MMTCPVRIESNGGYWVAAWRDSAGKRKRKSLGAKSSLSRREANRRCHELAVRLSIVPGARDHGRSPTLGAWLARYLSVRDDLKSNTASLHRATCDYLISFFGPDQRLDTITREQATDWRVSLGQRMREATVCRHVRTAKTIFSWAKRENQILINPFDHLNGTPPQPDSDFRIVTDAELWRLIGACRSWGWACLVGLCGFAGLRRSEALALTWSDVDWERGRIHVRNPDRYKGSKRRSRDVMMEPDLRRLLDMAWWRPTGGPRVCRVPENNLHRDMVKIIKCAGLEPWPDPFHTLRKSRATQWAGRYPAFVVDAWIGHSMAVARRHYRRVPDEYYTG